jgi:hypothetical protein
MMRRLPLPAHLQPLRTLQQHGEKVGLALSPQAGRGDPRDVCGEGFTP